MRSKLRLFSALAGAFLLVAPQLGAQQITGRVTTQSGEPLAAVQVFIAGSGIGALSQQNGRYLLLNVPVGTHTLTAERIGFASRTAQITVAAGQTAAQDFVLSEQALGLDEIIVTGTAGGTQRRAIGNTVSQVSVSEVTQTVAINSMQGLLSGRTPGITFARQGGGLGAGSPITIRGLSSFNLGGNPLLYVDGVRVNNNAAAGPNVGDGRQGNVLEDFNPADIESIEIIKGPAAATLYGTEASAGVIQIITKRGAEGAPQFSVSAQMGNNFMLDPSGRLGLLWACRSKASAPCASDADVFSYDMYEEANQQIADGLWEWPEESLFTNGLQQSYDLNVRGGTQSVRYFAGAGYEDGTGFVWFNTDEAFRGRANVSVIFSEMVTLDIATGYVQGKTRYNDPARNDGGIWTDMVWGNGYTLPHVSNTGPYKWGFQERTPADIARVESTRDYQRFTGGMTLNFTSGLFSSRAIVGLDRGWDENSVLFPIYLDDPAVGARPQPPYGTFRAGMIDVERPINTNLSLDWSGTARKSFGGIGTATSVGAQYYLKRMSMMRIFGQGFPSPLSRTVNQTPPANSTLGYEFEENKSVGLYVQEELSWQDRIFVTAAMRFDDNSAFGSEFSLEKYPKVSAAWVVSEEGFWNFDLINSLRLRGAWGKAGRQPSTFAGSNQYSVIAGPNGTSALNPSSPGNPLVGPETSTELELGFDFALLEDRVSGEFTYYNRTTEDALLSVALPPSIGFGGTVQRNLGQIDNWGWEVTLANRIYESDAFSFNLDLGADHSDNEIKSLGEYPGNVNIRIGYPWPNFTNPAHIVSADYGTNPLIKDLRNREIVAMCDSGVQDMPAGALASQYGVFQGGETRHCNQISRRDILLGPANATYKFSVSPVISLFSNRITLRALAEGQHGRWGKEQAVEWSHRYDGTYASRTETDPFWVAGDRVPGRDLRVMTYFKGGFWKLREIGGRIQLPENLLGRVGSERGSISISANNLWNLWQEQPDIWGATVSDPEFGSAQQLGGGGQSNFFVSPPMSSVSATLNLSF
jgi:TonB-linked SusC/RagA family outer membrane protein